MREIQPERSVEPRPPSQMPLAPQHEPGQTGQQAPTRPSLAQRARSSPYALSQAEMQVLQRTIGNRAVAQLFQKEVPLQKVAELAPSRENNTGLPGTLKAGVEALSGLSMDDVQVHYNSSRPASLEALAYAQGAEIHVGPGQEQHLAHEIWHVVQQKQGRVKPTLQAKGMPINDEQGLEREADVMGRRVTQRQALPRRSSPRARSVGDSPIQLMAFYHGTELKTAKQLAGGKKIKALGKGELGGGFYVTHDQYQAAHIADYYTNTEKRGTHWGVVAFEVDDELLKKLQRVAVGDDEFKDFYARVKGIGQDVESRYDWTMSQVKDKKTPYMQHLFAQEALVLLNHETTQRALVLSGQVNADKALYEEEVARYELSEDAILDYIEKTFPEGEGAEEEEEEEEFDETYFEERVTLAIKENSKNLTKKVVKDLEEIKEEYPDVYQRLMQRLILAKAVEPR